MTTARFIKDIERCPYLPVDKEYDEWNRKDRERLEQLEKMYQEIKITANQLLSWNDRRVTDLAKFVLEMIKD